MASRQLSLPDKRTVGVEAEKRNIASRSAWSDLLLIALWFGLAGGLFEGIIASFLKGVSGFAIRVSPEILWIAPAFNTALFLLMGIMLGAVFGFRRKALSLNVIAGLFSWVTLFGILLLVGKIHQAAALVLSLGVAVQISRWLRGRERRLLLFLRRTVVILMIAALVVGVAGAQWDYWRERTFVGALPSLPVGAPNLLLITLDTLRADHLSSYGYERQTSPNIDRLARGGTVFESAFSNSSWTLPAHASLFTGRLPHEHRADWLDPLDAKYPTLAEALSARGYRTAAFSANAAYVAPEWGLARGFSRFEMYGSSIVADATTTVYGRKLALNLLPRLGYYDIPGRKRAAEVNREFLTWLDKTGEHPFFAFLNYFDLHDPYLTDAPHRTRFSDKATRGDLINFQFQAGSFRRKPALTPDEIQTEMDSYDGCLAYLDARLGELLDELVRRGLDKNTLVIVTSDHGEAFGNHDLFGHGNSLYLETLRVPLIFYWPGRVPPGVRASEVVGLHQVPATVMELLGGASSASLLGQSLAGFLTGKAGEMTTDAVLSELSPGRFKSGPPNYPTTGGGLKSLVTDEWHFIVSESGRIELYNWRKDPQEARNLAEDPEARAVVEQLKRQLNILLTSGANE